MKTIVVDTNGILRFILNDIPSQKKTFEQLLQKAKRNKVILLVPQIIIFEIEFTLRKYYSFDKEKITEQILSIVSVGYLRIEDREIFAHALRIYKSNTLSFVDCFLLAKAQAEGAELFTFDKKLKKLA